MTIQCDDNYNYNKKLKPFARQLRRNLTKSEACLWKYALKEKQLKGYQFKKQRPVLEYIADFFCTELMLIIEIDGITHDNETAHAKDTIREEYLKNAGYKIVRFTDEEVINNIAGVVSKLERIIDEMEASSPVATRHPLQRGTGGGKNAPR